MVRQGMIAVLFWNGILMNADYHAVTFIGNIKYVVRQVEISVIH